MSARRKRVISTEEIQFNHKSAKMLLTKNEGSQPKWLNHKYNWDRLILCTRQASIWAISNTASSKADPVMVFPLGRWCPPWETSQPHPPQELQSENAQFWKKKSVIFLSRVTFKFDGWPWKTIGHLFYTTLSFAYHFKAIGEFKLELQSGNAQFRSKSAIFSPVWPWNLTDDLEKQ